MKLSTEKSASQIETGLYSFLKLPSLYSFLQKSLGSDRYMETFIREYVRLEPGKVVLDIGWGTGIVVDYIAPNTKYVGFDFNEQYIKSAESKYGNENVSFFCGSVSEFKSKLSPTTVDSVISMGVLHHLNDRDVLLLFEEAANILPTGGSLTTIDPTLVNNQHWISRLMIKNDRGRFVRKPEEYKSLANRFFTNVGIEIRHDLLRIPYTHCILRCSNPT